MSDLRIAHFSDIHMAMAPNRSTINVGRFFTWWRWVLLRRRHHSMARLDRVLEMIVEQGADMVICTGDLSHAGLPYELTAISDKFNILTDNKIPMLLTGGNHDYYNRSASQEIARLQQKHGLGLEIDDDGICRIGDLTVLMLHQAIYNPFYMARGKMPEEVLDSLESRLKTGSVNTIHLAAGHHPVCDASGHPISMRKRLDGDMQLKQFLKTHQVPAYLCGHCHTPFSISLGDGAVQYCSGSITCAGVMRWLTYRDGQLIEESTPTIHFD